MTLAQARRVALAAQGFGRARPGGRIDRRHGRGVFDRVGVIQIDSVNVLCRSQELPLVARLGRHRRDLIATMTDANDLFEYWAHEASHVPTALHPVLRWRMHDAHDGVGTWGGVAAIARDDPKLVAAVLHQVREQGPVTIGELTAAVEGSGERHDGMWGWSPGKRAVEYLFWSGEVTATRGPNFERRYDLPERVLPAAVLAEPTPKRADAHRSLLAVAARAHGVGTAADLADYFRLKVPECRPALAELVEDGTLVEVAVEGWRESAYLHGAASKPRRVRARALLSPFDSLVWERARTERLFGFRYRIEIYVPAAKRVHGYYVLPFLLDEALVARVDLKADRQRAVLWVRAAYGEAGIDEAHVAGELAAELGELAHHLGLDSGIDVDSRGDLAAPLAAAVTRLGLDPAG